MLIARNVIGAAAVLASTMTVAFAADLETPSGDVVLTVSGAIDVTNDGDTAKFDAAMLEALGETTFTTTTPWTDGEQTFTGVSLKALVDALEVEDGSLAATAINDYAVEIPFSDAVEGGPIIAYLRNGEEMSVRDKGPLWVVYPYDLNEDYRSEEIYSRSIWQLDRIVVSE